jgi:hypothetical protein
MYTVMAISRHMPQLIREQKRESSSENHSPHWNKEEKTALIHRKKFSPPERV